MPRFTQLVALVALLFEISVTRAQPMTFAEVQAGGAKAISAAEVKDLVSGAKTVFKLVNGTTRI
jgi:hypothetical protein